VVSLGHELSPDDDIEAPLGDILELLAQPLNRFDEIARQHQDPALGKQLRGLLLQPFDSRTDRDERIRRLTVRALRRERHGEPAMVADEAPPEAMIDQPGIAIGTGEPETTAAAKRQRRIAAAIEEEKGLLAALKRIAHGLSQTRGDEAAARRAFGAQIDHLDGR
jgi:hypothetical protein